MTALFRNLCHDLGSLIFSVHAALERQTANNPHRKMLHEAVKTMRAHARREEVPVLALTKARIIVGLQRTFHFFTPSRMRLAQANSCALVSLACWT